MLSLENVLLQKSYFMKITFQKFRLSFILIVLVIITSCKPEKPTPTSEVFLEAKLQLTYNGNPIELNETLISEEGYPFQVKELKLILSQIKNGEKSLLDAAKLDLSSTGNTLFKVAGMPTSFEQLQGAVGVVEPWNNADPVSFSSSSPLYLTNVNDMHWGWASGYIFYKIEGVFSATPGSSNLDQIFTYHIGMNQYRKSFSWENITWTKINDTLHRAIIKFNVDDFLNGTGGAVNLATEPFTHATPDKAELNEKIATNFAYALRP
jgi:hypothetical protein